VAISSKAQHIAEAERLLDGLAELITDATTVGVPAGQYPVASLLIAYANAHSAVATAYGGMVEPTDVAHARAKLADAAQAAASGPRLVAPRLA
jgi:hypothetical protein